MKDFVSEKLKAMKWNPIVSFRMPKDFYVEFEDYCHRNYLKKSEIVLKALELYFETLEKDSRGEVEVHEG
ncbi:hypothetical protein [Cetobacterium sp. SF1]|uniref:hypothetical protein n=1 Tax=Cetobacterium sp. SF1 TaxID=3417654 RepID=UPI003CF89A02